VGGAAIYLLPALAGCASVAFLFTGYGGQNRWLAVAAVAAVGLSVLSGGLMWWFQRRGATGRLRWGRKRYLAYLERVDQELAGIAAAQQGRLAHDHPDSSTLAELVAVRRRSGSAALMIQTT